MKVTLKTLTVISIVIGLMLIHGCGPTKQTQTEPQITKPEEPSIEELRKPVAKDPAIYKAVAVIKDYGRLSKEYISYEKYLQLTKGQAGGAVNHLF